MPLSDSRAMNEYDFCFSVPLIDEHLPTIIPKVVYHHYLLDRGASFMVSSLRSCVIVVSMRPETTRLADECKVGISAVLIRRISDHTMLTTQPQHIYS